MTETLKFIESYIDVKHTIAFITDIMLLCSQETQNKKKLLKPAVLISIKIPGYKELPASCLGHN
jgi:hypothetical protein